MRSSRMTPYRQLPRAEIVLAGDAAPSVYMWSVWLATVAFVGLIVTATDVARTRALLAVALSATVVLVLTMHQIARRFRWRIVLEGSLLRIERIAIPRARSIAVLDVSRGLKLAFELSPHPASIDMKLVLITDSTRTIWDPGQRLAPVVDALVNFLRQHDVEVSEPPPVPVGWPAPGGTLGG